MYPYFSRFQPEDDQRFWFYNSMHFPEVVPAFDGITSEIPYTAIGANTARLFCFPTTMGIEYRIVNGRVYITANPVLDEAEQGKRFADFQERAGHYYANWDRLYGEWQQRIEALIADIEAVEVPRARRAGPDSRSSPAAAGSPPTTSCARTSTAASTCTRRCGTTTPSS